MTSTKAALAGRTVLITRARAQAPELRALLTERGARVLEFPAIRFAPPASWDETDAAFDAVARGAYHWVVFTSANGVRCAAARAAERAQTLHDVLRGTQLAAIGPATAAALGDHGLAVHLVPAEFRAEGIVEAFGAGSLAGVRILLARAETARDVLPRALAERGAHVDVRVLYRTLPGGEDAEPVRAALRDAAIDAVTFASSSTVHNVVAALEPDAASLLACAVIVCIGPITADTAREYGLTVARVARAYTIPGLVDAVVEALDA